MKIRNLQLKNIGVFDDETIEFQKCPEGKAEIHIFTGQNGTGKTTILMALASAFRCNSINVTEINFIKSLQNVVNERIFSEKIEKKDILNNIQSYISNFPIPDYSSANSYIHNSEIVKRVSSELSEFVISLDFSSGHNETISAFYNRDLGIFLSDSTSTRTIPRYGRFMLTNEPLPKEQNLDFAAFAYSSYRNLSNQGISSIYDNSDWNPLFESLNFNKEYDSFNFNQWVANNISKSALVKVENSNLENDKFFLAVKKVENFIYEITGQKIEFGLSIEPFALHIKQNGQNLDFDVLPDGLKSLISWIGDLLMRLDKLKWNNDLPIFERGIILFLDEIEVHLHPAWQRKVLPVMQKLFKNSQIFVSTHSPFVVNSIDDAWVYKLELENGKAKVAEVVESENSDSITQVLREIFGVDYWFGWEVQKNFDEFKMLKNKIISNGADEDAEKEFLEKARLLADEPNDQLKQLIREELENLSEIKQKNYSL